MAVTAPLESLFKGSNGSYYTDWQVHRRLQTGAWTHCIRQLDPDRRLVETDDDALLLLVPIDAEELPSWAAVHVAACGVRVVDTRRPR